MELVTKSGNRDTAEDATDKYVIGVERLIWVHQISQAVFSKPKCVYSSFFFE